MKLKKQGLFNNLSTLLKPSVVALSLLLTLGIHGWAQLDVVHYFPPIHSRQNSQIAEQYVYLSTPVVTPFTVTLEDGAGNFIGSASISKDNPNSIYIGNGQWPATDVAVPIDSCMTTLKSSGFIATAASEFYCNVRIKAANQATSVACKGSAALGKVFYAGSMPQAISNSNRNFVTSIMATENGTIVNVSDFDTDVVFQGSGGGIYADDLTLLLNEGDCYVITGYTTTSLTNMNGFIGGKITSNKDIAVNTGNYMGSIHTEGYQDGGMVQIVPTALLGTDHLVVEGEGGDVMERPLVVAVSDGTEVFLNDIVGPVTTLNEGEYYLIPASYYGGTLHHNMAITTSNPAYVYQCTAANTSSATSEFNFIPPLACYLSEYIDAIPDVDRIGPTVFDGILYIVTTTGSVVTVNGDVLGGADGPEPAPGLPDWETYKLDVDGDVAIESDGAMAAGFISVNGNAAAGAYYAGFTFDFQVEAGDDLHLCVGEEALLYGDGAGDDGIYVWDGGLIDSVAFVPGGTMMYHVVGTNIEGCEDDDSVLVTVYENPTSDAGADQNLCDTNATTLNGSIPLLTGGGLWTMASGPSVPTFVDPEDPLTITDDLVEGTYALVWTVSNGTCPTITDTVLINVYDMPDSDAGIDLDLCDIYSINLNGNLPPGSAAGEWSVEFGPSIPTITDITDPNTLIADLVEGTYSFIWTMSNGTCPTHEDTTLVNVYDLPVSMAGLSEIFCGVYETNLNAMATTGSSTGEWTMASGPSVPTFADVTEHNTNVSDLVEGTYEFVWTVSNGTCPPATASVVVQVYDPPVSDAGSDVDVCDTDISNLNAAVPAGSSTGMWTNISGPSSPVIGDDTAPATDISGLVVGTYAFVWTVSNGICEPATDTVLINIIPMPQVDFMATQTSGCAPLSVSFTNLSTPVGDNCQWDFGDGGFEVSCGDVAHTFNEGTFDITLTVTANGCTSTKTVPGYITAVPYPEADFTLFPEKINITSTTVTFNNHSENAETYSWYFNDGSPVSNVEHPEHNFPEAIDGLYEIVLIAENGFGCADTAYGTVAFEDLLIFYIPNTFTPDGSGTNDTFEPVFTSRIDPYDFHMQIFNRWGELLFETYDLTSGWDGTFNDLIVEDGTYVWSIVFGDTDSDKKLSYKGHVNILK